MKCIRQWMAMACLIIACTMAATNSQAGVVLNGTRFVYPSQEKEITIKLINQGKGPVLVKTWIDSGDMAAQPETIKVPYTLTPPIFRMDADKEMALRLVYTGDANLPKDRESLYWLNVVEVPPRPNGKKTESRNTLQLAFRYRLKLFFRPEGLSGSAKDAAARLAWSIGAQDGHGRRVLRVTNDRPYYVSLAEVKLKHGGETIDAGAETIAPLSSQDFVIEKTLEKDASNPVDWSVEYRWIDEWGGLISNSKPLVRQ